jgi:predicted phage gp36 major capsid-like protein
VVTSSGLSFPLGTIAGQVDSSRELLDFSQPGIDDVISDDLGVRIAEGLDAQLFNGTGAAGTLKGFLQTSGIITVTGSVTNRSAYLQSRLQAFSQLAGTSVYGSAERENYLFALHPMTNAADLTTRAPLRRGSRVTGLATRSVWCPFLLTVQHSRS